MGMMRVVAFWGDSSEVSYWTGSPAVGKMVRRSLLGVAALMTGHRLLWGGLRTLVAPNWDPSSRGLGLSFLSVGSSINICVDGGEACFDEVTTKMREDARR